MATKIDARSWGQAGIVVPASNSRFDPKARMPRWITDLQISAATRILVSVNLALLVGSCVLFSMVQAASMTANRALVDRHERLEIANEVGRGTNQLTRVARAYAVTGEPRYLGYFENILAIRDGRMARPAVYDRGYWDLVIAGRPEDRGGRTASISTLAREVGFSAEELALLDRLTQASGTLAAAELAAARQPAAEAQSILFGEWQGEAKAHVLNMVNALIGALEARSHATVQIAQERAFQLTAWLIAFICLAGAVALGSAFGLMRGVVQPLSRLSAVMSRIAHAHEDRIADHEPVPFVGRGDEIGRMARALEEFRDAIAERDRLHLAEDAQAKRRHDDVAAHRHAMSDATARTARAGAVETLVRGFSGNLAGAMVAVRDASGQLNECAQTMTLVAHGTERRVAEAEEIGRETATHVDLVASTCRQLARATGEIELQTERSIASADRAVDAVQRTGTTVDELTTLSRNIQGIVTLISQIATKTNRLAINATIEAAHAGEAGRGFKVVAAEVKSLAKQTAEAADDISHQLGAVRHGSQETAEMVEVIARSIAESREISLAIGSAVERQASATGAISLNADCAARQTRQCADTMATIRVSAGHTHEAIARVLGAASTLTGTNDAVRTYVDTFAGDVQRI